MYLHRPMNFSFVTRTVGMGTKYGVTLVSLEDGDC